MAGSWIFVRLSPQIGKIMLRSGRNTVCQKFISKAEFYGASADL